MNLNIVAPIGSSLRLNDAECAAAARRRRRKLFTVLGLAALSWLVIGALVVSLA